MLSNKEKRREEKRREGGRSVGKDSVCDVIAKIDRCNPCLRFLPTLVITEAALSKA